MIKTPGITARMVMVIFGANTIKHANTIMNKPENGRNLVNILNKFLN
jgi:hypothetical protein